MTITNGEAGQFANLMEQARMASAQGDRETARSRYTQAAQLQGGNPDMQCQAALGLEYIGCLNDAEAVYRSVVTHHPAHIPGFKHIIAFHMRREQPARAESWCRQALAHHGQNPDLHFYLGQVLANQMQTEPAIEAYERAWSLYQQPDSTFYREYGIALERANRLDDLKALLDEGLARYPRDPDLVFLSAKLERRCGRREDAIARLETLDTSTMEPTMASRVHFEMGRLYDSLQDIDRAYASFSRGNVIEEELSRKAGVRKDLIFEQIDTMSGLPLDRLVEHNANSTSRHEPPPVFLVGFPRSGTTLLHHVLLAHPDIDVIEEKPILFRLRQELEATPEGYPGILLAMDEDRRLQLRQRYQELMRPYLSKPAAEIVINKLPLMLINLPLIYALFPEAKVIFVLRHPCDACLSGMMQIFSYNTAMANLFNLDDATRLYNEVMKLGQRYLRDLPLDYHLVRYEDVVEDLEKEARRAVGFLGLEWKEEVLDYRRRAVQGTVITTPSYHQVMRPIYKDALQRWRRYEPYLRPHLERLRPYCEAFGYDL